MPRFVVLQHDHPRGQHWDLMLEVGDALATWALDEVPHGGAAIAARALADHRLAYLDYEGPVSGDRGRVTRWDAGDFDFDSRAPDRVVARLRGARLIGQATLTLAPQATEQWLFSFLPD